MLIAIEGRGARTPSGVPCALRTSLHFTPDGVSRTRAVITINIALLTEGQTTDHRLQSSDPFTIGPISNRTRKLSSLRHCVSAICVSKEARGAWFNWRRT